MATKTHVSRKYNANITGMTEVDFFRENYMANVSNATDEEKKKEFYSFRIDGKDFKMYFHSFEESVLAYLAVKNGVSLNDLYLTVKYANLIIGGVKN